MKRKLTIYLKNNWICTISEKDDKTCVLWGQFDDGKLFSNSWKAIEYIFNYFDNDLKDYELIWN